MNKFFLVTMFYTSFVFGLDCINAKWIEYPPRKIVYATEGTCGTAKKICTGYVTCESSLLSFTNYKYRRLATCGAEHCANDKGAQACVNDPDYYSEQILKHDKNKDQISW